MKKLLGLLLLVFVLVGCAKSEKVFDFEKDKLVVGLEAAYAPFNWMEAKKTETNYPLDGMNAYVDGYDVQMAKRIAEELGLELVIKMISWKGLITSLKSGVIDLIIAGMSPTEERMKSISFTDAYYESEHVVVVLKNGKYKDAKNITDFVGANVIGQKSTIYDDLAGQIASNSNANHQVPLDSVPKIITSIKSKVSDVTVVEKPVAISIVNNNPELKYIALEDGFEISESDKVVSIGVRKSDTLLLQKVNEALSKISKEEREQIMLSILEIAPEE